MVLKLSLLEINIQQIIKALTNFPLVQFSVHYAISFFVQFATFKRDDVCALKIFMCGSLQHSHVVTFLYLKVHIG